MDTQWIIAAVSWALLLGGMLWLILHEWRKTPEQKQAEREEANARHEAYKAARRKEKANRKPAPNYGWMYNSVVTVLWAVLAFAVVLFTILLLVMSD